MMRICLSYRLWIGLLSVFTLGLIVFLADRGELPEFVHRLYHFPFGDKIGHFVLIGLLAFGLNLVFSSRSIYGFPLPLFVGSILAIILATVEEISQNYFASRSFSLLDLGCSYLGILAADFLQAKTLDNP
jgi:VanZ family protein